MSGLLREEVLRLDGPNDRADRGSHTANLEGQNAVSGGPLRKNFDNH
jgi:hypothetical protein